MRREEEERRERHVAGITVLYNRERDIALAAYDGVAAAEAIATLAEAIHGTNTAMISQHLKSEAKALHDHGGYRGSNVHLIALIEVWRKLLTIAASDKERGLAQHNLGLALWMLGERESGEAKLEEAVAAYREALKERTRECVPLDWAKTQNNLGLALWRLGERESGTAKLEEAVAAHREVLEEWTRDRVPLHWAAAQTHLGIALQKLGECEGSTARLEEAVAAHREALKERTRERVPFDWAMTQNHLGNALLRLGGRESGTAKLQEAVAAYREALKEWTPKATPHRHTLVHKNMAACLDLLEQRRGP